MRRLLLAILLLAPAGAAAAAEVDAARLFEAALLAPDDVTTFVHVEQAGAIRADLARRPIFRWVERLLEGGQLARSWHRLATAAGVDDERLFELFFGRRITFIGRRAEPLNEWVIRTEVDPEQLRSLAALLRLKLRPPMGGLAVGELPEEEFLLAHRDGVLLIAPSRAPGLLEQVARRAGRRGGAGALADHPAVRRGALLGPGRAAAFVRHDAPMGGWSVVVGDVAGDRVTLRHEASFESAPFDRGLTKLTWDIAPLEAFEDRALLAVIEPSDVEGGQVQMFLEAVLREPLLSEALRENLGEHRLLAVGEVEGRLEESGVDLLLPTAAVCLQVLDGESAERQLDEKLLSLVRRINDVGAGSFLVDVPPRRTLIPGTDRHLDLGPAVSHFGGGFPVMQRVSLNWTVVEGPRGPYCVIATHPVQLRETVAALERDDGEPIRGRWAQCGTANGQRLGTHLRSYGERADLMAAAGDEHELRRTIEQIAAMAEGVSRCRWKLERPSANEMRLEVELRLSQPESAAGERRTDR